MTSDEENNATGGEYIDGTKVVIYVYEKVDGEGTTDNTPEEDRELSPEGDVAGESKENPPKTGVDGFNMLSLLVFAVMGMIIRIKETIKL